MSTSAPSTVARLLGLAGLIPFLMGATGLWLVTGPERAAIAGALLAYGAVIVSFLGGIHWGLVMRDTQSPAQTLLKTLTQPRAFQLVWGVTPSLLAWGALLLPARWGLLLTATALLVCYGFDRVLYSRMGLWGWLGMRGLLTGVATACCVAGAAALLLTR